MRSGTRDKTHSNASISIFVNAEELVVRSLTLPAKGQTYLDELL